MNGGVERTGVDKERGRGQWKRERRRRLYYALLYAADVLPLTKAHMSTLDHLVDRAFYRIFACTSSEDIQFLRSVLDLPGLSVCINERQARFVRSFSHSFS